MSGPADPASGAGSGGGPGGGRGRTPPDVVVAPEELPTLRGDVRLVDACAPLGGATGGGATGGGAV